jgi:hemolysin activation/secretion protein
MGHAVRTLAALVLGGTFAAHGQPGPLPADSPDHPPAASTAPATASILPAYDFDDGLEDEALPAALDLPIADLRLEGHTVLTAADLTALKARFSGRRLGYRELSALRDELTALYIQRGYVTSGATIRSLSDGVLTIDVVEGRIDRIQVETDGRFRPDYVATYLQGFGPIEPVNVFDLEQRLQMLQQSLHVARVDAVLLPGERPGESVLRVRPTETRPWSVRFEVSNHQSPAIGEWHGLVSVGALNLSGRADDLHLAARASEGLQELTLSYEFPITARDSRLELYASGTRSEIVTAPFDQLGIEAETRSYGLRLSHPWHRTPSRQSRLSLALERRSSETFLLGSGFSFVEGPDEGESRVTVVRAAWQDLYRSGRNVLASRAEISAGVDAFGATRNAGGLPDGEFRKLLLQAQWARFLDLLDSQLVVRADAQLTSDPLLGIEQIALGGRWTVRGYRENTVIRDNAVLASVEWRVPVWRGPLGNSRLEVRPFFDWSYSWNEARPEIGPQRLASVGLGLLWQPAMGIQAEVVWGHALRNIDYPGGNSVQDDGIHVRGIWRLP